MTWQHSLARTWLAVLCVALATTPARAQSAGGALVIVNAGAPAVDVYVRCLNETVWHPFTLAGSAIAAYDGATWAAPCAQYGLLVLARTGTTALVDAIVLPAGGPYAVTYDAGRRALRVGKRPVAVLSNDAHGPVAYTFTCSGTGAKSATGSVRAGTTALALGCADGTFAPAGASGTGSFAFGDGQIARLTTDVSSRLELSVLAPPAPQRPARAALAPEQLPPELQRLSAAGPASP